MGISENLNSTKNTSARTSAQQLPIRLWAEATLVIDSSSQG
jgi:hypothetical protein